MNIFQYRYKSTELAVLSRRVIAERANIAKVTSLTRSGGFGAKHTHTAIKQYAETCSGSVGRRIVAVNTLTQKLCC